MRKHGSANKQNNGTGRTQRIAVEGIVQVRSDDGRTSVVCEGEGDGDFVSSQGSQVPSASLSEAE